MIGGEFEINPDAPRGILQEQENIYYYSSGRAALFQILKSISDRNKHIWLPDYLCTTIVKSVASAGFLYSFYELNNSFETESETLSEAGFEDGDTILLINYFGLQHLQSVTSRIRKAFPTAIIIEDDVQAFFEFNERPNPDADYRYTSLRKTFPVTDGAPVYTKHPMPMVSGENTFAPLKLEASYMKYNRDNLKNDDEYLALFKQGNDLIDSNLDSVMSEHSKAIYAAYDLDAVKRKRRANVNCILSALSDANIRTIMPVPDDSFPLFVPIWLENRDDIRKRMFEREVFCPVHWPTEGMVLKRGNEMFRHELSLICDQRYSVRDISLIINDLNVK